MTKAPRPRTRQPRQDRAAATQERILQEALLLFSERGFDGASTRDLAQKLGINHALVNYHFGTKEALWQAAVHFLFGRLDRELARPAEGEGLTAVEEFSQLVRRYVIYCARFPEHARLMVQESMSDNPRIAWAAKSHIRPGHLRLEVLLKKLIGEGLLPDVPPIQLIYALAAVCQAPFMLQHEIRQTHDLDAMTDEFIESYAQTVLQLMLRRPPIN